jgi:hypothetical protein
MIFMSEASCVKPNIVLVWFGDKGECNMIGIWSSYADIYLIVAGIAMLAGFGLPLVLVPLRWASLFRWDVSQVSDLVIFLGRSLGVFITVIALYAFKVSQTPSAMPFYYELMLWTYVGMILLHVHGAIRKIQPITETIEIGLWIILCLVTLCFYPS